MQKHDYQATEPVFFGAGYEPGRDKIRLTKSLQGTYDVLRDQNWHTLESISQATDKPEASVSANIRSLRNPKNGGYFIDRRYIIDGLHEYRLDHNIPTNWEPKAPAGWIEITSFTPKDGQRMDIWDHINNRRYTSCVYSAESGCWYDPQRFTRMPSHVMHIPQQPKEK